MSRPNDSEKHAEDIPFSLARLKLKWSFRRFLELQSVWNKFCETDFCKVVVQDEPDGIRQSLRVVSVEGLPAEIPLTLGDVIHNMRAALDYTISELLGRANTRITFPMGETKNELIDSFRTEPTTVGRRSKKKGRNSPIEVAVPGIGDLIVNKIRPYKDSGNFLWALNKLDGCDKHRLVTPILVPLRVTGLNATSENHVRWENQTVNLAPGGSVSLGILNDKIKIESYNKITASIYFAERGIIEGYSVFPTLGQMGNSVFETIAAIETFVTTKSA